MRFAVITIELPLDGGDIEDATVLAKAVALRGITENMSDLDCHGLRPYGQIIDVRVEDRRDGTMGRTRAESLLRRIDEVVYDDGDLSA